MDPAALATATYRMAEFSFDVAAGPPTVAHLVDAYLRPFRVATAPGPRRCFSLVLEPGPPTEYVLRTDDAEILRGTSLARPFDRLLWEVSRAGIESVGPCVALHGGAVSWRDRGILLPGPSGAGKSTLTAALVRAGCSYLTDEAAMIDGVTGQLVPFPRALWIDRSALALLGDVGQRLLPELDDPSTTERHVRPDDLRAGAVGDRCAVRLIVVPEFVEDAAVVVEPMSRAETVMALIQNCFNFAQFGGRGLDVLAHVARGAEGYRLRGGDLEGGVAAVLELAGRAAETFDE